MTARPRLLVVAPRYPFPVVGGDRLRLVRLCQELAATFDLTLVCFCETRSELTHVPPSDSPFGRVRRVFLPRYLAYAKTVLGGLGGSPLQIAYYSSTRLKRIVDEEAPHHQAALAHLIRVTPYLAHHSGMVRAVELTDAISLNYSRLGDGRARVSLRHLAYRIDRSRILRAELEALERFDVCSMVSTVDRDFLAARGGRVDKVVVCTNGVRLDWPDRPASPDKFVVFIGNMLTAQNLDAADFYIREVHERLYRERGLKFRIVGRIDPNDARRFRSVRGVEVTGEVADVGHYAVGAVAGVCSVRIGAGVQNKILEYMAMGVPVVSSPVGVEGLSAVPERELLVAGTPDEWVVAISRIADDTALARRLVELAGDYVRRHHDWRASVRPLVERLRQLLSERSLGT